MFSLVNKINTKDIFLRYIFTIVTTILRGGLNIFLAFFLAKNLGVEVYGKFTFLIAAFTFCTYLLDIASSSAFFTFTSQNTQSRRFIKTYALWLLIQFLIIFSLLLVILPDTALQVFFVSENRLLLILAFIGIFFKDYLWSICSKMAEANRETIKCQTINIIFSFIQFFIILFIWKANYLNLELIFLSFSIEWAIASFLVSKLYRASSKNEGNQDENFRSIFNRFYIYCLPLIPYTLISVFYNFSDRWMLQIWGGFTEQAFYNISHQISTISILFTAAILKIFWKEISEYDYRKEYEKVFSLFKSVYKFLFFISALIAGFFLPWVAEIIEIALGNEYKNAYLTMFLLILYPIHQSLGQITGVVLLATSRTKLHAIIGIITMVISIIVTYFILAPKSYVLPGLNLGSAAVALKLIIIQLIQVNILYYLIIKEFKKEKFEILYQPVVLFIIFFSAFLSKEIVEYLFKLDTLIMFAISNIIYFIAIIIIIFKYPEITGVGKASIRQYLSQIKSFIKNSE